MENERQVCSIELKGKMTEEQNELIQQFLDAQAEAEEEYVWDIVKKLEVSYNCARAISYGRTRSWWTDEHEQALAFLNDRNQPIPRCAILRGEWNPYMAYEKAQDFIVGDRVQHVKDVKYTGVVVQVTNEGDCVVRLDGEHCDTYFCPHNLIPV